MPSSLPPVLNHLELNALEEMAYQHYQHDFGREVTLPVYNGQTVNVKRHPHQCNEAREFTYWHLVTEGQPESRRQGPLRERLQRVHHVRPTIEQANVLEHIRFYESERHGEIDLCLWWPIEKFKVVLEPTHAGFLLKTAYSLNDKQTQKARLECADYHRKKRTAPPH